MSNRQADTAQARRQPDQFSPSDGETHFYPGRLGLGQRVLPAYRAPFFDTLAAACPEGLSVFAGQPLAGEAIETTPHLTTAHYVPALNRHFLDPGSPFFLCWQTGWTDWLEGWQPQALILEANPRYRSTPGMIRWMHARQRPVIGWGLGAPLGHGALSALTRQGWPRFVSQFDALIAYSQRGADQYRALGFSPGRIWVAPNAVSPRPPTPPPARPPGFQDRPSVLFVGRLQARKRVDLLLHACAALPPASQPRLTIVGDGAEYPPLRALAQQVYPGAQFAGAVHGAALAPFFAAADLFILPGTGGLAVQQAMAHGLPVVVAQGDGTQDDLVRPGNGWRIPPNDLPALAAALQTALSDAGRLRQMGAESYRIVAEEINLEKMTAVFIEALHHTRV